VREHFFADTTIDDDGKVCGLGLIPGKTYDYFKSKDPTILNINWQGISTPMYFQGGPAFRINSNPISDPVIIFAYFSDASPAAIEFSYGVGRVTLIGPHPEAPADWFERDGLVDPGNQARELALKFFKTLFE